LKTQLGTGTQGDLPCDGRLKMGKKILKIALGLVGLIVLFAVGVMIYGATQPEEHKFTRSMQIAQPPEKIFETLADFAAHPSWTPNLRSIEQLADRDGKAVWRCVQDDLTMIMTVQESAPPKKLALHFLDEKQIADITWEISLGAITGGSLVSLKERGKIHGAFFRGMNRLFGGTQYADRFLYNLARKFGENAVIM
jgi:uncharacterized protein YndB with AHSA1/START domain